MHMTPSRTATDRGNKEAAHKDPEDPEYMVAADWVHPLVKTAELISYDPNHTSPALLVTAPTVPPSLHGCTESIPSIPPFTRASRATTPGTTVPRYTEPNTANTTSVIPTPGTGDDPSTPTTDGPP